MRFLRRSHLSTKTGQGNASNYKAIAEGLLPPPIKYGPRNSVWPDHEIDVVLAARVAGKSDDEIRELVKQLVEERTHALATALAHSSAK